MAAITKDRELVRMKRMAVLDEEDDLWKNNCMPCTKIKDAIRDGILPTESEHGTKIYWTSDRENPICSACKIHNKLRNCGKKLERLTKYDRALKS